MKRQQNAAKHAYLIAIFTDPIANLLLLLNKGNKIVRTTQTIAAKPTIPSEASTVIDRELARDILYPIPIIGEDLKSKIER